MPKKTVNIIGNGASNSMYSGDGPSVACNVPQHPYPYTKLFMIDTRPLDYMRSSGWRPSVPVVCTQQVADQAHKLDVEGDWRPLLSRENRWNSGHHAVNYYSTRCQEIHLWGFDSIWSNDLTSQCDTVIPRYARPPLNKYWHPIWQQLLDKTDCRLVVHMPEHNQIPFSHRKLVVLEHAY